jgi:hypothetical protein
VLQLKRNEKETRIHTWAMRSMAKEERTGVAAAPFIEFFLADAGEA